MLLVEMWNSKKALSRVAGQPAGEIRVLPAPTQEKEEDLTNSILSALTFIIHVTIHFWSGLLRGKTKGIWWSSTKRQWVQRNWSIFIQILYIERKQNGRWYIFKDRCLQTAQLVKVAWQFPYQLLKKWKLHLIRNSELGQCVVVCVHWYISKPMYNNFFFAEIVCSHLLAGNRLSVFHITHRDDMQHRYMMI